MYTSKPIIFMLYGAHTLRRATVERYLFMLYGAHTLQRATVERYLLAAG